MLKMRGDLPVSLAKDFSRGFSALLTYYEGMLMIRFVPCEKGVDSSDTPIPLCHRIHT